MGDRTPSSKIHLKTSAYEPSSCLSLKYSSNKKANQDSLRSSFKGIGDSRYQSSFLSRKPAEPKLWPSDDSYLEFPNTTRIKALTERRNQDFDFSKTSHLSNFNKTKGRDGEYEKTVQTDAEKRVILKLKQSNRRLQEDNKEIIHSNKYFKMENDFAIKRKEESEAVLSEKYQRINDLQRLNTFFVKRAEELTKTGEQLNLNNQQLKLEIRQFLSLGEDLERVEDTFHELQTRFQTSNCNWETERQQIRTIASML